MFPLQIFGSNKSKPKPNLSDAINSVSLSLCLASSSIDRADLVCSQTDTRIGNIEVKIKKLDGELSVFKTQMSKMKAGPGKVRVTCQA